MRSSSSSSSSLSLRSSALARSTSPVAAASSISSTSSVSRRSTIHMSFERKIKKVNVPLADNSFLILIAFFFLPSLLSRCKLSGAAQSIWRIFSISTISTPSSGSEYSSSSFTFAVIVSSLSLSFLSVGARVPDRPAPCEE